MYQKNLTIEQCVKYFDLPIDKVTKILNVSRPTISKVMRRYNVMRWPYRDLQARGVVWSSHQQQAWLDKHKPLSHSSSSSSSESEKEKEKDKENDDIIPVPSTNVASSSQSVHTNERVRERIAQVPQKRTECLQGSRFVNDVITKPPPLTLPNHSYDHHHHSLRKSHSPQQKEQKKRKRIPLSVPLPSVSPSSSNSSVQVHPAKRLHIDHNLAYQHNQKEKEKEKDKKPKFQTDEQIITILAECSRRSRHDINCNSPVLRHHVQQIR